MIPTKTTTIGNHRMKINSQYVNLDNIQNQHLEEKKTSLRENNME